MKKLYSLKSKLEFNNLIEKGQKKKTNFVVFFYQSSETFLLGISVPKKLGNAVFRNKTKRQIKNVVKNFNFSKIKYKLVMIVKKEFGDLTFIEKEQILKNEFNFFMKNS